MNAQYLINVEDITHEKREKFREWICDALVRRASHKLGVKTENLQIMELGPADFGLASWKVPPLFKGKTSWINCVVGTNIFYGIYKVLSTSIYPAADGLELCHGGATTGVFRLSACYSGLPGMQKIMEYFLEPDVKEVTDRLLGKAPDSKALRLGGRAEAYFSEPLVFDPNQMIRCYVQSDEGSKGNDDHIILGGYRIELKGRTIG